MFSTHLDVTAVYVRQVGEEIEFRKITHILAQYFVPFSLAAHLLRFVSIFQLVKYQGVLILSGTLDSCVTGPPLRIIAIKFKNALKMPYLALCF